MTTRTTRCRRLALILLSAALGSPACRDRSSGPVAAVGRGWPAPPRPADLPRDRALRAGFLVVDGVFNTELMAPYDVLQHTVFHTGTVPGIEVFTISPDGRPVTTFEGLRLIPHYSFDDAPGIDILVVPSAEGSMDRDLRDGALIDWVRRAGGGARFVVSLCDGAFVLAAAGLLDGRACTTFPSDQDRFAAMFPSLDLRRGFSFVHDGATLTSEGGARSYEVAMYLVAHLYGDDVARGVGRGLILPWPPEPGTVRALVIASPGVLTPGPPAAPALAPAPASPDLRPRSTARNGTAGGPGRSPGAPRRTPQRPPAPAAGLSASGRS